MIINGTCINVPKSPAAAVFINTWTGVSSFVAVIWLGRSMFKHKKFSQPKFLSLAVCFCDLVYTASSNSQTVAAVWLGYCVMGGPQGCVMRGFARNSTMVASHLMVVLLATERFIALRFPFRYQQLMSPKRVITVAVSLYLYAIFLATLPFMGVNKYGYQLWCDFYWSDTSPAGRLFVVIFLLQGFGCMLFTVFCNVSVIFELLAMKRRVGTGSNSASFQERLDHFKFMTIMTIVSVAYIGCSAPYLIRLACNQFGYDLSLAKDFDAVRVYLVNNMTNSYFVLFIQALFHPKVVEKFRACCRRMSETRTSVRGPEATGSVLPV